MSDAETLAHRFLTLWEDYLGGLLTDPAAGDLLRLWLAAAGAMRPTARAGDDPAADDPADTSGPSARAAPAAIASGECGDAVARLEDRVALLEQRLAAIERRGGTAAGARRRNRRVRD